MTPEKSRVIYYMLGKSESGRSGASGEQMRHLVEEMRFKEKIAVINGKEGRYKRSTNNCHKKYIGILRNLLRLRLDGEAQLELTSNYHPYRNSRVYYFIILSFLAWHVGIGDIRSVFRQFCREVEGKISRYKLESHMTSNDNFVHFRNDEITEMQYSLESINQFLRNNQQEAVRVLYQKNKYTIIKKSEFHRTLQILRQLQDHLQRKFPEVNLAAKLALVDLDQAYRWQLPDHLHLSPDRRPARQSPLPKQEPSPAADYYQVMDPPRTEVKHQEQDQPRVTPSPNPRYPLLGLANSYPLIDAWRWNAWITHKFKRHEFYVRTFQDQERQAMLPHQNTNQGVNPYAPPMAP